MSFQQGYDAGNAGLLAAVNTAKMIGAIEERKRIIKLLEQHLGYGDSEWDSSVMAVIALIKGKNK